MCGGGFWYQVVYCSTVPMLHPWSWLDPAVKRYIPQQDGPTSNVSCKWGPQDSGTSDWLAKNLRGSHDCLRFARMTHRTQRCYTYDFSFILKNINQNHLNEETQRARSERLHMDLGCVTFLERHCAHKLRSSTELRVQSLYCVAWLVESLATCMSSISSPRLGWLIAPALITWLLFWWSAPNPSLLIS